MQETRPDLRGGLMRAKVPLLLAGGIGVATLALHLRDPHQSGTWGYCPLYALTGVYCPGCGGLRAVNDLSNLDLAGAASSNLLFVASIPLLVFLWVRWVRYAAVGQGVPGIRHPRAWAYGVGALLVVFMVVRNLPFGTWLAP